MLMKLLEALIVPALVFASALVGVACLKGIVDAFTDMGF